MEIVTAACILHNFCYINNDIWEDEIYRDDELDEQYNRRLDVALGVIKRDEIAVNLI